MSVIQATWEAEAGESLKPCKAENAVSQDDAVILMLGYKSKSASQKQNPAGIFIGTAENL